MVNIEMMKHAFRLQEEVQTLLTNAGVSEDTYSSASVRAAIDDIDFDIQRAEDGNLD